MIPSGSSLSRIERHFSLNWAASIFFSAIGLFYVAASQQAEKEAVQVADQWLALVDEGQFASSWDQAAELFKGAITKDQWGKSLTAVRTPLGPRVTRKVKSAQYATSLPGAPDGEYVVIQYESSFKNKRSAIETVTPMRDPDGKGRVSGYFIK